MKKICIIIPYKYTVPAITGGAVETLDQFLIDENEKNPFFEFTVLTTYNKKLKDTDFSYKYTKFIYYKQWPFLDSIWEFIYRAIKKVFHIYVPFSPRFISILNHLKHEGKYYDYVLFESGLTYMLPLIAKVYPKEKILNHMHWPGDGNKKIDKSFAYLLPVSHFCAIEWKKRTGRRDDSIIVWENCYDDYSFQKKLSTEERKILRQKYGIRENDIVLIYVGRIIPGKGVKELLLALQKIQKDNIVLLLIGKASFGLGKTTKYEKEIQSIIHKHKLRVIQLGFIPNSDLYKYYSISTLAIMPTLLEEAASMVNIEAMASGIPLITTNKGSAKEYTGHAAEILDVDNKFTEKLSHAIYELLADSKKREKLVHSGLEKSEQYTKKKYFNHFVSIIDHIEQHK